MGVEIVKAAVVYGKSLSGNAYKVLVCMSLSALDRPSNGRPASLYWGGWDALALALGYENADRQSSGENAVARAVRELKKGRHITPMTDAGRGTRQSYMVHPGGLQAPDSPEQNAQSIPEQSAQAKPEQNAQQSLSKTHRPRKEQGSEGLSKDIELTRRPQPQEAVEQLAEEEMSRPHKFQGNPGADCLFCDKGYADRKRHPLHLLPSKRAGA